MNDLLLKREFEALNCIAILGGTFNPVHKGHIMLAEAVVEQYPHIEKLYIMPNNIPAYKDSNGVISSNHRINMLKLAMKHIEKACISDMEIVRGGNTYTIDTLRQIKSYNPDINIYFVIGADSLYNIEKWREFEQVLSLCTIVAAKRDCDFEDIIDVSEELMRKYPQSNIKLLSTNAVNISSSHLRNDINKGIYDKEYLSDDVVDYIKANRLYRMDN